jgi:aminoglycoside phosphotransferase (APT) family kinase protein
MTALTAEAELGERLQAWLSEQAGHAVSVDNVSNLVGGNSRDIWRFCLDGRPLVLRRDPANATARFSPGVRIAEFESMRVAREHGVPAPEVLWVSEDSSILGSPFIIMGYVEGEAIPRRILRDEALAEVRPRLAGQCGQILARLHGAPAPAGVKRRASGDLPVNAEELDGSRLDALAVACGRYPALEYTMHWLARNVPDAGPSVLLHGDFRNGNLLVGPAGIQGVLDWESTHIGDPLEDLAWLCVRSWRFGNDHLHVGGFGTKEQLFEAYEAESGTTIDLTRFRWWEVLATSRWGIGCVINADYYLTGASKSIEMAALGRRVAEMEYDLLELIAGRDL